MLMSLPLLFRDPWKRSVVETHFTSSKERCHMTDTKHKWH